MTGLPGERDEDRVEIGLGIQSDKEPGEYARLATMAEVHGFDVLSVFGDLLFQPPIGALLEMARATWRVRLGAACWNPYTLHPYEIAGQVATLDLVSGGRAYLGLSRGAWLGRIGVPQPRPVATLRSAVRVVTALLTGDVTGIEDGIFPLAPGTALRYPLPDRRPPVLIGTWGEQTALLAGGVADETKVGGSANPAMVAVMRGRLDAGAAAVGRPAGQVGVVLGAVTVVDEDGRAARALARREVAMYLAVVAHLDPTLALPEGLVAQVQRLVDAGDEEAAGRVVPDDVLDLFAFSGTPEQVAAQAQRLVDAGVSRVEFGTPHGLTGPGGVELLGRRVVPLLDLARARR
jgi:5,10-methylenetetrahydromethanopterin reductase